MTRPYPKHLARGITQDACASEAGVGRCAFAFDRVLNDDGKRELSIQWLDNSSSVEIIKSIMKEGAPMFTRGFAVLKTTDLDEVCSCLEYAGLSYCRSASRNNPYHGSITLSIDDKLSRRQAASELALRSTFYPYNLDLPID